MTLIARTDHLDDPVSMWDDVLRSYADSLDEQRAFLLSAGPDELMDERSLRPPSFTPPATMPPMPDEFVAWAQSLLHETEGLALFAAEVLARMPTPVQRPHRHLLAAGDGAGSRAQWDRTM